MAYLYNTLESTPGKVAKIDLTKFVRTDGLTFTGTDENRAYAVARVGRYLYIGTWTSPAKIIKVDLLTFTEVASITLATGENLCAALLAARGYLYGALRVSPGKIVKINLKTFTKITTLTLATGENSPRALHANGNFLYAGLNLSPSRIVKIQLSTFTKIATLIMSTGSDFVFKLDSRGHFMYCAINTAPGVVGRIDLATFTQSSSLSLNTGEDYITFAIKGRFLYACTFTDPIIVVKIDIYTFTRVASITLNSYEIDPWDIFCYGNYLYVCTDTDPTWIVKIDLINFRRVDRVELISRSEYANNLVISGSNAYLVWDGEFFSGAYVYHSVSQIDLTTFAESKRLDIYDNMTQWGPDFLGTVIIGNYMYICGPDDASDGIIKRIDLRTFSFVDALTLTGYNHLKALTTDGIYLYASSYSNSVALTAAINKIDPSTFSVLTTIEVLGNSFGWYSLLVSGNFLYAGSWTDYMDKFDLTTFTWVAALDWDSGPLAGVNDIANLNDYLYCARHSTWLDRLVISTFSYDSSLVLSKTGATQLALSGSSLFVCCQGSGASLGGIVKVDLDTFTEVASVTLDTTFNTSRALCIAVKDNYIYAGIYYYPGKLYKCDLNLNIVDSITWPLNGENNGKYIAVAPKWPILGNIITDQLVYQHAERMKSQ